jgi:hypothetical protein
MKKPAESNEVTPETSTGEPARAVTRRAYVAPRLERKRAVERVTLLSGMGTMSVGVINMMN